MLAVASKMGFEKILEDAYPPVWGAGSVPSQQKAEQQFPFASCWGQMGGLKLYKIFLLEWTLKSYNVF